jgi:hypothetical protein
MKAEQLIQIAAGNLTLAVLCHTKKETLTEPPLPQSLRVFSQGPHQEEDLLTYSNHETTSKLPVVGKYGGASFIRRPS